MSVAHIFKGAHECLASGKQRDRDGLALLLGADAGSTEVGGGRGKVGR